MIVSEPLLLTWSLEACSCFKPKNPVSMDIVLLDEGYIGSTLRDAA